MIENVLERYGRMDIVGIASNAERAEHLIAITDPDVITLDIKMPDMDGLQLLDRIMARKRRHVIMLSSLTVLGGRVQAECMTRGAAARSEEHTSELQSLMRHSSAVFCLNKKNLLKLD